MFIKLLNEFTSWLSYNQKYFETLGKINRPRQKNASWSEPKRLVFRLHLDMYENHTRAVKIIHLMLPMLSDSNVFNVRNLNDLQAAISF